MKINDRNVVQQLTKRNKKALYYIIDCYGGLIKKVIQLIEMNSNYALADIPVIGNALEKFVYSKEDSLHNYKTVIGETVEDNGMKVTIEKLIITPASTKLTYKIDTADTDLSFRMYDQNGVELQGFSASTSGYDNYNRFIALESTITKLKVIPYITSYDEIDINEKVLYDKVFEIKVK